MNKEFTFDDAVYDPIISLTPQETRMFFNKYYLVTQIDESDIFIRLDKSVAYIVYELKDKYRFWQKWFKVNKEIEGISKECSNDIIILIDILNRLAPEVIKKYCSNDRQKKYIKKNKK